MRSDEWRQAMLAEADAAPDARWAADTTELARRPGALEWAAPFTLVVLLAAIMLLLSPNLNPGGWGVHSERLFQWFAVSFLAGVLGAGGFTLLGAFWLTRNAVRPAVLVPMFAALPLAVQGLGALVYSPSAALRSCVLDALSHGCLAVDRYARPLPGGVWTWGAAGVFALLAWAGASGARRERA